MRGARLSGIVLRSARLDERAVLEALQYRATVASGTYRQALDANPGAVELPAEQIEQDQVIVACKGGHPIGYVAVLVDDDAAEIDGLFVDPAVHRQGVGTLLMDAAIARTRAADVTRIDVTSSPEAAGFYRACGFAAHADIETRFGRAIRMRR